MFDIIQDQVEEQDEGGIRRETVMETVMEQHGLYQHEIDSAINDLKQRGFLFEPQHGEYLPEITVDTLGNLAGLPAL